jgi:hypothetical protein
MSSLGAPGIFGDPLDQPSPVSVLDGPFICDNNNRRLLYSSENFVTSSPRKLTHFIKLLIDDEIFVIYMQ